MRHATNFRNAMTHPGGILDSAVLGWLVAVVVLATSVITTILVLWALRVRRRLDQVKPGRTRRMTQRRASHAHLTPRTVGERRS
jgi:hypothetical protein